MKRIRLEIDGVDRGKVADYLEILEVLLDKGALDGVKNGKAIIHFDSLGIFQGVQLDYWPWKRRSGKDK
jgi:hypothetical protein